jgi:lipopolysaccharide/colanic/teichoic acid biosynthesis glycosyltransferase
MLVNADIFEKQRVWHHEPGRRDSVWRPRGTRYLACKRAAELVVAGLLLVLTAPLMLLAVVVIKLTSRGPAIYSQTRVGRFGRPYTIYKLRTMAHDCERLTGPQWATAGDPRITRLGRFLRRTHLDELPQLWNVIRGDMSLVGPRPERPEFVGPLAKAVPHYRARLLVRPGVTGLAQVQLPADTDLASVRRKLAYDLYYVRHVGPWLDLRIVLGTGLKMLGVPFGVLRVLFRLPAQDQVEQTYRLATRQPRNVPLPESGPADRARPPEKAALAQPHLTA